MVAVKCPVHVDSAGDSTFYSMGWPSTWKRWILVEVSCAVIADARVHDDHVLLLQLLPLKVPTTTDDG